jgi:hypothetical protein
MAASKELLLEEVSELIRTMPAAGRDSMHQPDAMAWVGRARAVMTALGHISFSSEAELISNHNPLVAKEGYRRSLTSLQSARYSVMLELGKTGGSAARAVDSGNVFDYFDEVRKICQRAKQSLFFVDPYMDVDFVSRYMPQVASGVAVRLLTANNGNSLGPAAVLAAQQNQITIELRQGQGFHDRYVFIDGIECTMSGTSFSAGAKKAPAALVPVLDFSTVQAQYEQLWNAATPKP